MDSDRDVSLKAPEYLRRVSVSNRAIADRDRDMCRGLRPLACTRRFNPRERSQRSRFISDSVYGRFDPRERS